MAELRIKTIAILNTDDVAGAALMGEIDLDTVAQLRSSLEDFETQGVVRVILDMHETSYVNSSALAVLVRFADNYREKGGGIALAGVSSRVKIPFEMLGLLSYFRFYDTVDAARSSFTDAQGTV